MTISTERDQPVGLAGWGDDGSESGAARGLDAACGPGFYARELIARGAEVVGFDASAQPHLIPQPT